MVDPFLSSRLRIGRATEHLITLKEGGQSFWNSRLYTFVVEPDPDGVSKMYKCRLVRPVPAVFDFLVIETIEHMRAALDHLGYAAAVLAGKREPKSTYFPIADSCAQLETDVIRRGRCKDVPADIVTLFRSLEPYQGGKGNPIWILNRLCNIGKHRFITSVGLQSAYADVETFSLPPGSTVYPHKWDGAKNEITYFSIPLGMDLQYNFELAFFIAFGPIKPVTGLAVIPILVTTADKITDIVLAVEAESRRIGLF